jgi:hypothetical protein
LPSSYSTSLRFELQFTGENVNTYGVKLDNTFARMDDAIAGVTALTITGDRVLVSSNDNSVADEARKAVLKLTGSPAAGFQITIPSVSKLYTVWNLTGQIATISTGSGTTVPVQANEVAPLVCDGTNVTRSQGTYFAAQKLTAVADPTNPQDVATKAYADALAFTANAGILPGQVGSNGKFLKTNGTVASWQFTITTDIPDYAAQTASTAAAMAIAFGRGR